MAILDKVHKVIPRIKTTIGYIKYAFRAQDVLMEDNTDLETKITELDNGMTTLDTLLTYPIEKAYGTAENCFKVKKMVMGTLIRKGTGSSSVPVFTLTQIYKMFDVKQGDPYDVHILFNNGDGGASAVHYEGCTYQSGIYYLVGDRAFPNGNIRINYVAFLGWNDQKTE